MKAIGELFQGLAKMRQDFLLDMFDKSVAIRAALVAFISGAIVAAYAAVTVILQGLTAAMPDELQIAASWVIPDNANECLTAVFGTYTIRALLDYKAKMAELAASGILNTK